MTEGGIGNDLVFKVIVIGDSGGGKSCLIQRYLTD
jgi:GTPase SAR1 family protein